MQFYIRQSTLFGISKQKYFLDLKQFMLARNIVWLILALQTQSGCFQAYSGAAVCTPPTVLSMNHRCHVTVCPGLLTASMKHTRRMIRFYSQNFRSFISSGYFFLRGLVWFDLLLLASNFLDLWVPQMVVLTSSRPVLKLFTLRIDAFSDYFFSHVKQKCPISWNCKWQLH